jgi:hypothetical protein
MRCANVSVGQSSKGPSEGTNLLKQLYGKLDALERSGSNETHLLAPVTTVYGLLLVSREYRELLAMETPYEG